MNQPDREVVHKAVSSVLFESTNHPNPLAVMGRDLSPLADKLTDSVMQGLEYLELKKKLDDDFPIWD